MSEEDKCRQIILALAEMIKCDDKRIKDLESQKKTDLKLCSLKGLIIAIPTAFIIYFAYRSPIESNIGTAVLLFGIGAIILELIVVLFQEAVWDPGDCIRLVGLTVIVTFVVYLAILNGERIYLDRNQFTAIIGFLGTTAGYLAGSMGKHSDC